MTPEPRDAPCPHCDADAGDPCVTASGRPFYHKVHRARYAAAGLTPPKRGRPCKVVGGEE